MAFQEITPLECVAMGASGGPSFNTGIVSVRSGTESRNGYWSQARHRFDVGMVARPQSQFTAIKDAFMLLGGKRDGFRFKDFGDYTVTAAYGDPQPLFGTAQVGTAGLGYGVPSYQLRKLYSYGSGTHYRDIRKPVAGTLILRRATIAVTAGVAPGNYALDTTTGIVTFVPDQTRAITSHAVGASHQVTLASALSPNVTNGQRIYIQGVTGTVALTLNDLSHVVTGVASGVVTVSTNTAGLTATGGNAFVFPQESEALDFSCEFDVPVRFDVDAFDAVIRDRQGAQGELLFELPSIPLIEIRA